MCVDFNLDSAILGIHQLMNVVPLIQEKWSDIAMRLQFSMDELENIWQKSDEHCIPDESKNTFCCIRILKQWFEANGNASVGIFLKAIDVPYIGLGDKMSSIRNVLTSDSVAINVYEEFTISPPKSQNTHM